MDLANFKLSMKEVFSKKSYILIASVIAVSIFILSVYVNNFSFMNYIFKTSDFSFTGKVNLIYEIFRGLPYSTNTSFLITMPIISILFGINLSLVIYTLNTITFSKGAGAGSGLFLGFMGMGCSACGSVILSVMGLGGIVASLPFSETIITILSIVVLSISIYFIGKNIQCDSCRIDK